LQVIVRDNNVDQALRVLKKKLQREGVFREMKRRKAYEKPSERKTREKAEAIRRARKAARKLGQREGLIPHAQTAGGCAASSAAAEVLSLLRTLCDCCTSTAYSLHPFPPKGEGTARVCCLL